MNNVYSRAEAIRQVIRDPAKTSLEAVFIEAVIACCADLNDAGEPQLALELASSMMDSAARSHEAFVRLGFNQARALMLLGQFDESNALVASLREVASGTTEGSSAVLTRLKSSRGRTFGNLTRSSKAWTRY